MMSFEDLKHPGFIFVAIGVLVFVWSVRRLAKMSRGTKKKTNPISKKDWV